MNIVLKRVYEKPLKSDGCRILVDRLWPRGLSKEKAALDLWLKDIAPSAELRKWFGHDPAKWADFKKKYKHELKSKSDDVQLILDKAKKKKVTLLYAAKDEEDNNAVFLLQYLNNLSG